MVMKRQRSRRRLSRMLRRLLVSLSASLWLVSVLGLASPGRGLTLIDQRLVESLESPRRAAQHAFLLQRVRLNLDQDLIVLLTDPARLADDPYRQAAWWSPAGTLYVVVQNRSNPQRITRIAANGNPSDGCLVQVKQIESSKVIVACSTSDTEPARILEFRVPQE